MRFAVLSNVQANVLALQAALQNIDEEREVDRIVCAGDVVGLGPHPNQVVDMLRSRTIDTALGNYDDAVGFDRLTSGVDLVGLEAEEADRRAVQWTRETLSEVNLAYIRNLPRNLRLFNLGSSIRVKGNSVDEETAEYRSNMLGRALFGSLLSRPRRIGRQARRVLVVHGSPRALNELVRVDAANSILSAIGKNAQAEVVISGHAGDEFYRELDGVTFVGVGSLSGPDAISGVATYAIVDVDAQVVAEFYQAEYDAAAYTEAVLESGLPRELADQFGRAGA